MAAAVVLAPTARSTAHPLLAVQSASAGQTPHGEAVLLQLAPKGSEVNTCHHALQVDPHPVHFIRSNIQ